jgi:hypothetical protein
MPRQLRVEYSGAIYHVINRGDRREDIFKDDQDRRRFLSTLDEACAKTEWQVHAYCLMRNHFHLVIETPSFAGGLPSGKLALTDTAGGPGALQTLRNFQARFGSSGRW